MQAVLVMFRNDGERRSFSISREMTVIGRRQDCDLMIPLGEISRKHCRIIREGDTLRLEDLGSSNGTFHNGKRIQETVLEAGDTIQVGPVTFVLQVDGVPADDELKPHGKERAAAGMDDDDLATLDDEEGGNHELETLGDEEELETLDEDKTRKGGGDGDDELEVLSEDSGGGGGLDLDAEIGENIALDDDEKLDSMDDSTGGDVTLDEEKPKRRRT
jgi:pSer/pThr/pTyr-binding forkhead associated (FHA) protein